MSTRDPKATAKEIRGLCDEHNVVVNDHCVFVGGEHTMNMLVMKRLLRDPMATDRVCQLLVDLAVAQGLRPDVVLSPQLSLPAGRWFCSQQPTPVASYATKKNKSGNGLELGYGFERELAGKKVVFIDDVLSRGTTTGWAANLAGGYGGELIGALYIADRGQVDHKHIPVPEGGLIIGTKIKLSQWSEEECRETPGRPCNHGIPVNTTFGHGAEFMARIERGQAT